MGYYMKYVYMNFNDRYKCSPSIRNGACFSFLDTTVKFNQHIDARHILVYLNDPSYSHEDAKKKIIFVFKILTFVFALPLYDNESYLYNNNLTITTNPLTSNEFNKNMHFLESMIIKFDKNYDFLMKF